MDAILLDKNTIEYYYELYQPNNIPQSTREPNIVDWRWDEGWKMMDEWWNENLMKIDEILVKKEHQLILFWTLPKLTIMRLS